MALCAGVARTFPSSTLFTPSKSMISSLAIMKSISLIFFDRTANPQTLKCVDGQGKKPSAKPQQLNRTPRQLNAFCNHGVRRTHSNRFSILLHTLSLSCHASASTHRRDSTTTARHPPLSCWYHTQHSHFYA